MESTLGGNEIFWSTLLLNFLTLLKEYLARHSLPSFFHLILTNQCELTPPVHLADALIRERLTVNTGTFPPRQVE